MKYRGIDTIAGGNGVEWVVVCLLPVACPAACCLPATGGGCEAHICLCHLSLSLGGEGASREKISIQ